MHDSTANLFCLKSDNQISLQYTQGQLAIMCINNDIEENLSSDLLMRYFYKKSTEESNQTDFQNKTRVC